MSKETYIAVIKNGIVAIYNSKGFFKRNLQPSGIKMVSINENTVSCTNSSGYTMLYDAETGRMLGHL